jgi:O-antigen ligase
MTLNLLPVIASQSRGPILSFLVTLFFIILFYNFNKKYIYYFLLIIMLLLTLIIFNSSIYNAVSNRLSENSFRKEIWTQSISRTIEYNPLLGCGRGIKINIPVETKSHERSSILNFQGSHNQFVDAFYSLGIIGLILFLAVFINIFLHYTKAPDLFPIFIWLILGTLCGLTVSSCNIDIRSNWMCFWIPTGLIGAILSQKSLAGN